jgi:hypothetical protein
VKLPIVLLLVLQNFGMKLLQDVSAFDELEGSGVERMLR